MPARENHYLEATACRVLFASAADYAAPSGFALGDDSAAVNFNGNEECLSRARPRKNFSSRCRVRVLQREEMKAASPRNIICKSVGRSPARKCCRRFGIFITGHLRSRRLYW